jgi:hypothetical protein
MGEREGQGMATESLASRSGVLRYPTSRATSSASRPASNCFKAPIISASVCLRFDILLPLSFVRNRTRTCSESGEDIWTRPFSARALVKQLGKGCEHISGLEVEGSRPRARMESALALLAATAFAELQPRDDPPRALGTQSWRCRTQPRFTSMAIDPSCLDGNKLLLLAGRVHPIRSDSSGDAVPAVCAVYNEFAWTARCCARHLH